MTVPVEGTPRFDGELEPQASLLPPEYFQGVNQNAEILQMVTTGGAVSLVTKSQFRENGIDVDLFQLRMLTKEGLLKVVTLAGVGANLAELVERKFPEDPGDKRILWSQTSDTSYQKYSQKAFFTNTGFSSVQNVYIAKRISEIAKKHLINMQNWVVKTELVEALKRENTPRIIFNGLDISTLQTHPGLLLVSQGNSGSPVGVKITPQGYTEVDLQTELSPEERSHLSIGRPVAISEKSGVIVINSRGSNLTAIKSIQGSELRTLQSSSIVIDDTNEPILYSVSSDGRQVQKVDLERAKAGIWNPENLELPLPAGAKVEKLDLDPHGNFLAVGYSNNGNNSIAIVDKETGRVRITIDETSPIFAFDPLGNLICVDAQKRLRKVQTNFDKIPTGGIAALEEAKKQRLAILAADIENLKLPEVQRATHENGNGKKILTEEEVTRKLEGQVTSLARVPVDQAKTVEELVDIKLQLEALKKDPRFINHPEAFQAAERMILLKENGFRVDELEKKAALVQTSLGEVRSLEQAADLSKEVAALRAERATGISIMDPARRALIDARLNTLQTQAAEAMKQHLVGIGNELQTSLEGMQLNLQTAANESEVGQIFTDPSYMRMTTLLGLVQDPLVRQEWEQKMIAAVAENKRRVAQAHSITFTPQQYEQAAASRVASQILTELAREITDVKSSRGLKEFNVNPLVTKFLEQAKRSGGVVEHQAKEALQKLLDERRGSIETERSLEKMRSGDIIPLEDGVEFPIFVPPPPEFQVKTTMVEPLHKIELVDSHGRSINARSLYEIEFVDSRGRNYKPGALVSKNDYDAYLQEQTVQARHYFERLPRNVPKPAPDLKMTPWFRRQLSIVANAFNIQLEQQEGIVVIEGPAGCGKNFVIDTLAALSDREIFIVPCHSMMDKEDLTYTVRFDPKRGTIEERASLPEALETEGAIAVFNEWNTAPTGVTKLTNPLTDYQRTLYLSLSGEKRKIRAKESVILVGVMNPIRYAGTKQPPEDALDRARVIAMGYPQGRDEAATIYSKVASLKKLQTEELEKLWDYIVAGNTASGGDIFLNPERAEDVKQLRQLTEVSAAVRKARKDFETGVNLEQEVHYDFSLRSSRQIAIDYEREKRRPVDKRRPIKEITKDFILPKIGNLEERERIKTIIENA